MISLYPYIQPAPFVQKMRYDYAQCQSESFMNGWRLSREKVRERLLGHKGGAIDTAEVVCEGEVLGVLLERTIKEPNLLWNFIKKYEVFGKFYSHYTPQLRKHECASPANNADYIRFAEVLMVYVENQDELQYLSTLLKVMDGLCGFDPAQLSNEEATRIVDLINKEAALVRGVM